MKLSEQQWDHLKGGTPNCLLPVWSSRAKLCKKIQLWTEWSTNSFEKDIYGTICEARWRRKLQYSNEHTNWTKREKIVSLLADTLIRHLMHIIPRRVLLPRKQMGMRTLHTRNLSIFLLREIYSIRVNRRPERWWSKLSGTRNTNSLDTRPSRQTRICEEEKPTWRTIFYLSHFTNHELSIFNFLGPEWIPIVKTEDVVRDGRDVKQFYVGHYYKVGFRALWNIYFSIVFEKLAARLTESIWN